MKEFKQKAKDVFISEKGVNAVCITTDGSSFDAKNHTFADSHSQRFQDKTIHVFGKDETFLKENENLFIEGSKWVFHLISDVVEKAIDKKTNNSKLGEIVGDVIENVGDKIVDIIVSVRTSKDELIDLAKDLAGFDPEMKKAELVELINNSKL